MQQLKSFCIAWVSAFILMACANSSAKNEYKDGVSLATGSDMYYEYAITSTGKNINLKGYTKMYVSSKGDARVEMKMLNSAVQGKISSPMVIIGSINKPNESISIDDDKKTYTINHIDRDSLKSPEKMQSVVTKMGEEKLLGFNCVHARIISNKRLGSFYKNTDTFDIWRSNDIPVQEKFIELMKRFESQTGNFMYSTDVVTQLKQMGCDGFMVKLKMRMKNVSMTDELTKAEHKDFPAGIFKIPAGYKEIKNVF